MLPTSNLLSGKLLTGNLLTGKLLTGNLLTGNLWGLGWRVSPGQSPRAFWAPMRRRPAARRGADGMSRARARADAMRSLQRGPARHGHGHGHGLAPDTLRHRALVLARISSAPYRPALGYGRPGP